MPPLLAYGAFGAPKNFGPGAVVLNKGPATPGSGGGGAKLSTTLPVSESLISSYAALWTSSPPCDKHIAIIHQRSHQTTTKSGMQARAKRTSARAFHSCAHARARRHTLAARTAPPQTLYFFFSA